MSNMKCPVCNVGYVHESVDHWCCDYEFCPSYSETDTETYDVLIHTRKALDVAVDALKSAHEYYMYCAKDKTLQNNTGLVGFGMDNTIAKALDQITVLEQKD